LVNYVSIIDLININEIEDDFDNEDKQKHDDVPIGINEVGSIPLAFYLNFAPMDTKELNCLCSTKVKMLC
jgi:hypothetical protein